MSISTVSGNQSFESLDNVIGLLKNPKKIADQLEQLEKKRSELAKVTETYGSVQEIERLEQEARLAASKAKDAFEGAERDAEAAREAAEATGADMISRADREIKKSEAKLAADQKASNECIAIADRELAGKLQAIGEREGNAIKETSRLADLAKDLDEREKCIAANYKKDREIMTAFQAKADVLKKAIMDVEGFE